jgi:hypothetical protein
MTKRISPKFYRGKINMTQFNHLTKMCPRMTSEVYVMMREFFVNGKQLSHLGVSKQAAHQRAKYYMKKGVELGLLPRLEEK